MTTSGADEFRIAVLRLARRIRAERAADDLSDTQLSVLSVLWKQGPQTLGALSEYERITPPSANRTVNALADAGLVTRSTLPEDARKVLITATEEGLGLARETKRRRAAWLGQQLEALSEEERRVLDAATPTLRRLADT